MATEIIDRDNDIEAFTHDLGIAIFDLNKKHSNVLYRTNLGNAMIECFRFINHIKEKKKENGDKKK